MKGFFDMVRPTKKRLVSFLPGVTYFKPAGVPLRILKENQISVEELEAIRLRDIEEMEQETAAEQMKISRPTFQRILSQARFKIADALINGKAMRIAGGNYVRALCRFRCRQGHEWDVPFNGCKINYQELCPTCKETVFECVPRDCCQQLKDSTEAHPL